MDMMDLRARFKFSMDLEFAELDRLARKTQSGAVFLGSGAAWSSAKQALSVRVNSEAYNFRGPKKLLTLQFATIPQFQSD